MRRTRGATVELTRHFLARMFDGEWSAARGQWAAVAIGLVAMALPAGMLMLREGSSMPQYAGRYRLLAKLPSPDAFRATALADEIALLVVLAAVTGLAAVLVWQSLFPGRRDYLALAGLPVRSRQIFTARFAAVALFAAGLVIALNLLPSVAAPFEFAGRWQKNPSFWANLRAQAAASGLECCFVFFAIVALQGVLLNLLPARLFVRVSVYVQGTLFGVFALAVLRSWSIKEWNQATVARLPQSGGWAPPIWFAGLHEVLLGDRDPFFVTMASRAATGTAVAIGLSAFVYWLSYARYRQLLLEAPERAPSPRRHRWSIPGLLARDPRERAVMEFMAKTLARSRTHRMIWLAYIGFAVAIVLNSSIVDGALFEKGKSWEKAAQFLVLFWPLACSAVLLPGMKHVLRIPAEQPANWIFRLNESHGRRQWMTAVDRFVLAYTVGPLYALLIPVAVYYLGWSIAACMTVLQVLASLCIFEVLFYSWQQLPFACSYFPGKRPIVGIVGGYIWVLGLGVPVVSVMIAAASRFLPLFCIYCAGFLAGWLKLRSMRREGWGEAPLLYQDLPTLAPDLGIREISSRTPSSALP